MSMQCTRWLVLSNYLRIPNSVVFWHSEQATSSIEPVYCKHMLGPNLSLKEFLGGAKDYDATLTYGSSSWHWRITSITALPSCEASCKFQLIVTMHLPSRLASISDHVPALERRLLERPIIKSCDRPLLCSLARCH
jgi:hypothetical protein